MRQIVGANSRENELIKSYQIKGRGRRCEGDEVDMI